LEADRRKTHIVDERPLKIAFIIPYFYPAWQYGGQPRAAYDLARGLVRRGHNVRVITTDSGGDSRLTVGAVSDRPFFVSKVEGIEICYFKNISNWLAYHQRVFLPRRLRAEIHDQLKDRDVIHIHELRSTLSVIAARAVRDLKKPYVLSGHGGLKHLGRHTAKTMFDSLWGNRILKEAAAIVAVSPVEAHDAKELGIEEARIHTIPNAIDVDEYKDIPSRSPRPQILFLGRLHRIKGADILIEAFAIAKQSGLKANLVIAGPDDGEESNLRALVRARGLEAAVTFPGYLDRKAKLQAFADSTVTVIASRAEVFALTALESLLCGTPALLSSVCGLFPMPVTGVAQFQSGDVQDLANKLLNDYPRPNERLFIERNFSLEQIADQTSRLYRHLPSRADGVS
jgi:glycosyltransferase involved in cell wall biosynthesis